MGAKTVRCQGKPLKYLLTLIRKQIILNSFVQRVPLPPLFFLSFTQNILRQPIPEEIPGPANLLVADAPTKNQQI